MIPALQTTPDQRLSAALEAYLQHPCLKTRNALVQVNLPLVWQVARRESLRSGASFEDLAQVGAIGLIKAVERFDPTRGNTLSTAAVPWIRGAIRHHLRDHGHALSGSRSLIELWQRARQLQNQQQRQGLEPLAEPALLKVLGCSAERWRQAKDLQTQHHLTSLDKSSAGSESESGALIEQLPDPRTGEGYAQLMRQELRRLLWKQLKQLQAPQRRLVLARVLRGQSWRELGAPQQLSAKATQKRCQSVFVQLRQQLEPQLSLS
jgi:RNA polymerase sigma factor (sigma-70 family)